jgi:hypothetical protein
MNYRVEFTDTFHDDLRILAEYIAQGSIPSALNYREQVLIRTKKSLSFFPGGSPLYREKLPPHLQQHQGKVRKLVIDKTTLVYFRVYEDEKRSVVLHVRRSWKPLEIL